MSDEAEFLQKIQATYAAQSADAVRMLNSLLFEYAPVLEQFAALKAEMDRALANAATLDVGVLVQRFRPALDVASRLAVDIDLLEQSERESDATAKFMSTVFSKLTVANAEAYAEKFAEIVTKGAPKTTAALPPEPSIATPPRPMISEDELAFAQANDLYYGDNGQAQDLVQAAVLFHRLAEKKHPAATRRLSLMYSFGEGVKQRYAKAASLIRAAADLGDPEAMASVSAWYRGGSDENGFPQSYEQAKYWALRAIETGALTGAAALGDLYADEKFPEHNFIAALDYYQQGSAAGDSSASLQLGLLYRNGNGVPKDIAKALAAFERSVQQGKRQYGAKDYDWAIFHLVSWYERGDGEPVDPQQALAWFHRAGPATKGEIAFSMGNSYGTENPSKAIAWLTEGAAQQHGRCMSRLGHLYLEAGERRNVDAAERWYLKATEAVPTDCHSGFWQLSRLYDADGAKPDESKWLYWQERAAELDDDDFGYYLLGSHFYRRYGNVDNPDFPRALAYYEKGIAKGGTYCANELADIYRGMNDFTKAAALYKTAIQRGHHHSWVYLGWVYRDGLKDIDKAIAAFKSGADTGDTLCFNGLIECLLKEDFLRKDPSEAMRWLSQWEAKPVLGQYDLEYLVSMRLDYDEIRDVVKARQYCDRLATLPEADPNAVVRACHRLGKFLLEDEAHQDISQGVKYLELAAGQSKANYYECSTAINLLIDLYDHGKGDLAPDAECAKAWREARDKVFS